MSSPQVDIKALASLARIDVPDSELARLEAELPAILAFVETIQKVATDAAPADETLRNVMREDANPHESGIYTEKILAAAPGRDGDRVAVKQVLHGK